jgi:glycosyltransferase involved in cell wall biosynthesis
MKICYLTWGETPRSYGIYGSQVIGQFVETKATMPDDDFYFISAVPIIHSGLVREKFKYKEELDKVKENLDKIKFEKIPLFCSQNFVLSTKRTFGFMHFYSHKLLHKKLKKINPDVLHCRSYHAAWAALKVKEKYTYNYKIIFDPRGLYPEEVALKLSLDVNGKDFKFLKKIEKVLLESCDVTIAVSDTMKEHYEKLNVKKTALVYLGASSKKLKPNNIEAKFKTNKKNITFSYLGALSNETWHKIDELIELFQHLKKELIKINFIIITTSNHTEIKDKFKASGINDIVLKSTKTVEELKNVLEEVDFGLLQYRKKTQNFEIPIGDTMLGTKTIEYLLAGLPVIVNNKCGGASKIIDKYGLGISYNPNNFKELTKKNIINFFDNTTKFEISVKASELFDYEVNALKYNNIYKK